MIARFKFLDFDKVKVNRIYFTRLQSFSQSVSPSVFNALEEIFCLFILVLKIEVLFFMILLTNEYLLSKSLRLSVCLHCSCMDRFFIEKMCEILPEGSYVY